MKIMQIIPNFCFGGAETMCENLCYALRDRGEEVLAVSLYDEHTPITKRMEEAGIRIQYLDKKLGLDLSMVPKLIRLMKKEKPDAVHTHLDVIKYAVLAAKLSGVRHCIHTVHNVAHKEAEGRLQKLINSVYFHLGLSRPVALSALVRRTIVDFYAMEEEKIPVIYNGVDLSRCIPKVDYAAGTTLLHIGRFNEQKNHRGLLRAFAQLQKDHPGCRLRLVGDGELRPEMEALAKSLGIGENVEFCGLQSQVYPFLNEADIFLLPSAYEGMPMTLIEAMGTGLPIVATAVGGVPDMLTDGQSALLVECDEDAVRQACERLINDGSLRRSLGQSARERSVLFSAETMAEQYLIAYQG